MSLDWAIAALVLAQLIVTVALYVRVGRLEAQVGRVLRRKPRKHSGAGAKSLPLSTDKLPDDTADPSPKLPGTGQPASRRKR